MNRHQEIKSFAESDRCLSGGKAEEQAEVTLSVCGGGSGEADLVVLALFQGLGRGVNVGRTLRSRAWAAWNSQGFRAELGQL